MTVLPPSPLPISQSDLLNIQSRPCCSLVWTPLKGPHSSWNKILLFGGSGLPGISSVSLATPRLFPQHPRHFGLLSFLQYPRPISSSEPSYSCRLQAHLPSFLMAKYSSTIKSYLLRTNLLFWSGLYHPHSYSPSRHPGLFIQILIKTVSRYASTCFLFHLT